MKKIFIFVFSLAIFSLSLTTFAQTPEPMTSFVSPPTPSMMQVLYAPTGNVTLQWNPFPSASYYKLYYVGSNGVQYENYGNIGNITSYTKNNLSLGTYMVNINAVKADGQSSAANFLEFIVQNLADPRTFITGYSIKNKGATPGIEFDWNGPSPVNSKLWIVYYSETLKQWFTEEPMILPENITSTNRAWVPLTHTDITIVMTHAENISTNHNTVFYGTPVVPPAAVSDLDPKVWRDVSGTKVGTSITVPIGQSVKLTWDDSIPTNSFCTDKFIDSKDSVFGIKINNDSLPNYAHIINPANINSVFKAGTASGASATANVNFSWNQLNCNGTPCTDYYVYISTAGGTVIKNQFKTSSLSYQTALSPQIYYITITGGAGSYRTDWSPTRYFLVDSSDGVATNFFNTIVGFGNFLLSNNCLLQSTGGKVNFTASGTNYSSGQFWLWNSEGEGGTNGTTYPISIDSSDNFSVTRALNSYQYWTQMNFSDNMGWTSLFSFANKDLMFFVPFNATEKLVYYNKTSDKYVITAPTGFSYDSVTIPVLIVKGSTTLTSESITLTSGQSKEYSRVNGASHYFWGAYYSSSSKRSRKTFYMDSSTHLVSEYLVPRPSTYSNNPQCKIQYRIENGVWKDMANYNNFLSSNCVGTPTDFTPDLGIGKYYFRVAVKTESTNGIFYGSENQLIEVSNLLPLSASCSDTSDNNFITPTNVTWTATATGGTPSYTYNWLFENVNTGTWSAGTGTPVVKNYASAGLQYAFLTAIDKAGAGDSVIVTCPGTVTNGGSCTGDCGGVKIITNGVCKVGGSYSSRPTDPNLCTSGTASTVTDVGYPVTSWTWNCNGSGTGSTNQTGCTATKIISGSDLNCNLSVSPSTLTINLNSNTTWTVTPAPTKPPFLLGDTVHWTLNGAPVSNLSTFTWNKIFTTVGTKIVTAQVYASDGVTHGDACSLTTTNPTVVQQGGGIQEQ